MGKTCISSSEEISVGETQSTVSSRWNPTREQITILESLYRQGIRTPTAQQIQQITSRLRMFGNIEGKNVFYWFQNHKARQRQKEKEQKFLYINQFARPISAEHGFAAIPHANCTNIVSASGLINEHESSLFLPEIHLMSSNTMLRKPCDITDIKVDNNQHGLHNLTTEFTANEVPETLHLFPLHPDVSISTTKEDQEDRNISTHGNQEGDIRISSSETIGKIFEFFPEHPCQ